MAEHYPTEAVGRSSNSDEPTVDEIFHLLANRRRRIILSYLMEQPDPIHINELTNHVAGRETEKQPNDNLSETAAAISTNLHHVHLPKLTAARLVEYEQDTEKVRLEHPPEPVEEILAHTIKAGDIA